MLWFLFVYIKISVYKIYFFCKNCKVFYCVGMWDFEVRKYVYLNVNGRQYLFFVKCFYGLKYYVEFYKYRIELEY